MTWQQLASEIARREGKKSQVHIGNIREVLKVMKQLEKETATVFTHGLITSMFSVNTCTLKCRDGYYFPVQRRTTGTIFST